MSSDVTNHERRQRRRHGIEDVRASVLFSHECRILNLSADGMAVQTGVPLAPGRSYTVKVEGGSPQLRLAGTVAWCRLQGTARNEQGESLPQYAAGIELQPKLSETARELSRLLEDKGVIQLERSLDGYLVPHGALPEGGAASSFAVLGLSRTGMVVSAPLSARRDDLLDLRVELGGGPLELTVRVTKVRPVGDRDGQPFAELTLEHVEMAAAARGTLEALIREELGLGPAPGEEG